MSTFTGKTSTEAPELRRISGKHREKTLQWNNILRGVKKVFVQHANIPDEHYSRSLGNAALLKRMEKGLVYRLAEVGSYPFIRHVRLLTKKLH